MYKNQKAKSRKYFIKPVDGRTIQNINSVMKDLSFTHPEIKNIDYNKYFDKKK